MDLQIIFTAALVILLVVLLIMIISMLYNEMKEFLSDNVTNAVIDSAEAIVKQLGTLQDSMTDTMNTLQNENKILRKDITAQLEAITSIINDANEKAELGVNSIVKELNYIVPTLRDEMNKMLAELSKNAESFQKTTLQNLEAEVKKFIHVLDTSCENLNKAAQDQSNLLASVAGTVQGVLNTSAQDIQGDFARTRAELQDIMTEAMKQIDADYQENMRQMFAVMADNLASITQELRASAKADNTPAASVPVMESDSAPKAKKSGKKKKDADPVPDVKEAEQHAA